MVKYDPQEPGCEISTIEHPKRGRGSLPSDGFGASSPWGQFSSVVTGQSGMCLTSDRETEAPRVGGNLELKHTIDRLPGLSEGSDVIPGAVQSRTQRQKSQKGGRRALRHEDSTAGAGCEGTTSQGTWGPPDPDKPQPTAGKERDSLPQPCGTEFWQQPNKLGSRSVQKGRQPG